MADERSLQSIPDDELLQRLAQLLNDSRRTEADVVTHIGEVEERRLYAREACPSMFVYCTDVLHFSEAEAYLRITVARAARQHPALLGRLADARLHLSGIARLAPYMTAENRDLLMDRATHRSKRQILELIAELFPQADAPARMRKLPLPRVRGARSWRPAQESASHTPELCPDRVEQPRPEASVPAALVVPLAPARYKVQFTATAELHDKLERLQALMRSKVPDGDLAAIIEEAVTEKLARLEARRFGATKAPRTVVSAVAASSASRHIPAAVKRAVSERDGRQCHYQDRHGRRCPARSGLEYHHRHPFGFGGDNGPDNLVLLCRVHHGLQTQQDYGPAGVARTGNVGRRSAEARPRGPSPRLATTAV
jgi:hypothetical protein